MDSIYAASPSVALLVAVSMQLLKRSDVFPWITRETEKLNAIISVAAAVISGIGLAVAFDWDQETGKFALGFTGNAYDLLHLAMHAPLQWAQQHGIYKLLIALPEAAGETRDLQRQILNALAEAARPKSALARAGLPDGHDVGGGPMQSGD
jgi:hypothetical protein